MSTEQTDTPPLIQYVGGWTFPNAEWFKPENITAALNYKALDGDIILCSYPRTGTTWMEYIILQILHKGELYPDFDDITHRVVPFMEITGIEALNELKKPRFYQNHFSYYMTTRNKNAKYIYVHRDPVDMLVSSYHFMKSVISKNLDFNYVFENFLMSKLPYGDYFDHVLSFYSHRNDKNVLFVSYEELHKDTRNQILRVAEFLGEDYHKSLIEDENLVQKILHVTSFDYMKKNLHYSSPSKDGDSGKVEFFRKGEVGDGKNHLSQDQMERLMERTLEKMRGTKLADIWIS